MLAAPNARALLLIALSLAPTLLIAARTPGAVADHSAASADSLRIGDLFPPLVGPSLSGKPIVVPDTSSSRYTLVVFGFSRAGGDDAGRWNRRVSSDSSARARADVVVVAELEGAPRLMRGLIARGIRRGTPPSVRDQMMILDHDDALWKRRLAVSATERSYAVLIAPNGRIRWKSDGPYDDSRFTRMRDELR